MEVRYVDFEKCAKLKGCSDFKGTVGLYDPNKDIIHIHTGQSKARQKRTLNHEKAHRMIDKAGVKEYFTDWSEEVFCDLWEVLKAPLKDISCLEAHFRMMVMEDFKWGKDKKKILKSMLLYVGVDKDVDKIVGKIR